MRAPSVDCRDAVKMPKLADNCQTYSDRDSIPTGRKMALMFFGDESKMAADNRSLIGQKPVSGSDDYVTSGRHVIAVRPVGGNGRKWSDLVHFEREIIA